MKPSLQVRLSQHLALTPQLQQSIRLLQLSTLELHQEVEQMLEQNPFLEADEEGGAAGDGAASAAPADAAAQSTSAEAPAEAPWEGGTEAGAAEPASAAEADAPAMEPLDFDGGGRDDWENGTEREDFDGRAEAPASRNGALDDDESDWTERNTVAPSLADHLREQLLGMRLAPEDMLLVEALIDSLNEDGYLADPLEEVAERLAVILEEANPESTPADAQDAALAAQTLREDLLDRLRCALGWLQNLEPAGVGARDLCECLQLQLRDLPDSEAREAAMTICRGHLESLAKRDLKRLMAATAASEETVREAQALIVALEPKPGRRFTRAEANIVVPDVIVQKSGRGWKVVLNPDVMPKLRINDMYAQVLRQHRSQRGGPDDGGAGATLSARLQEARWFVKNILQRFDTIQRV
ncbi:MAG TPA: RNA polymerase factor sigma-54, partial [Burkholderiaceae bacterium]|nr:RNA polymerase factor sigma-54 [Burkholderiaceae bacterium]